MENNQTEILNEQNEQTPVSNNVETPIIKKKKNKIIPVIITLVVLLGLLSGGYYLLTSSPKTIFGKALQSGFDYLTESIDKQSKYNTVKGEGAISYEISSTDQTMKEMFETFNGITLDYNYSLDYKNKIMNLDLNSNYKNDKLLNLNLYTENQKGYILLKDVYEKYISTDIEGYDEIFSTKEKQEDLKVIISSIEKALANALTKDDFTKEKATISIDGKDVKVVKNSLVLDKNNINRISIDILTTLKNDDNFIKSMKNFIEDEELDLKAEMEAAIKEIKNEEATGETKVVISLYTKGLFKEVVKYEVAVEDETENFALELTKAKDDEYSYKIKQDKISILTGTIKITLKEKAKKVESDIKLTANVSGMINLTINMKNKDEYGVEVEKIDVSNSVDAYDLTDEDTNQIMTKLMENQGIINLVANIQSVFGA